MKKLILNLLVLHGIGINLIAAAVGFIYFQPVNKWFWFLIWLASLQINAYCIYKYKRKYPDMTIPEKDEQKSPWLTDLFK